MPFSLVAGRIVLIHSSVMTIMSVLGMKKVGLSLSFNIVWVIGLLLLMLAQRMFIPIVGGYVFVLVGWGRAGKTT